YKFFSKIVDHRVIGRTKFKLDDIIAIAFIATMAGCHGWKQIHPVRLQARLLVQKDAADP
ncbi:MAG: transposase family protein, partial [Deltaproteobacteria bacterium]|nr:transposase family protein [Deltaproteobacteria bacterium]